MYLADLHIHSSYSRATSKDCDLAHLDLSARNKGIRLVGTGDFTHPAWRAALREQYDGITTIVIAQRVSSILHADHILVLDEGKEIGYGTHEQLMESCAVYREISESQMGGDFG